MSLFVAKALVVAAAALAAVALAAVARADGSFTASDPGLTGIWQASVKTADDAVSPPVNLDPRDCTISEPSVVLDSPVRDRCPYAGDLAVTGMTLLVSGGGDGAQALRDTIAWFASVQNADGSIPGGAIFDHSQVLVDYNAYWVEDLYDYTLYTGDLGLLDQVLPNLVRLMNVLYPAHVGPDGVLLDWTPGFDYAYTVRGGSEVAYYDAQYIRALGLASQLATWAGDAADATAWAARETAARAAFGPAFWDPAAGAFSDTTATPSIHTLDGNVFAILAGAATAQQEASALAYVARTMARPDGDAVADTPGWNFARWGDDATQHIYPFISYYELLALYAAGDDAGALDLIRREWGSMLAGGPGTMWETINAGSGRPDFYGSDVDHGWSSGAAPALTAYVLGVLPTSPGFASFTVTPHPSGLDAADGDVPTPHGDVQVYWQSAGGVPQESVTAPPGTTWANAPPGAPVDSGAPAISGSLRSGAVLTADPGTWSGAGPVSYAYQWARCASNGLACAAIAGETASSYTVQDGDPNGTIRVFVTGTTGTASSSATALIGPPAPDPGDGGGGSGGGGGAAAPAAAPAPVPAPVPALPPAPALLPVEKFTPPSAGHLTPPVRFRLVLRIAGRGTIQPGSGRYRRGERLTLKAKPARGWRFARWSGRWCRGAHQSCRVTMTQGKDVKAVFARRQAPRRTRS